MKMAIRPLLLAIIGLCLLFFAVSSHRNWVLERDAADNYYEELEAAWDSVAVLNRELYKYLELLEDSAKIQLELEPGAVSDSLTIWFMRYGWRTEVSAWLLFNVARVESAFRPDVRSSAGALGLMQVMPLIWGVTFREQCGEWQRGDVETNICIGAHVLRHYLNLCAGGVRCALSMYNSNYPPERSSQGSKYAEDVLEGL
jgi:soluble lytic murein transglycosylase-like protein